MRRPVMYLAGLLLATGASLALAGPASAAPAHHVCNHGDGWGWQNGGGDDLFFESNRNSGNTVNGIALLNHWGDSSGFLPIF